MKVSSLFYSLLLILTAFSCSVKKENASGSRDSLNQEIKGDTLPVATKDDAVQPFGKFVYDGGSLSDGSGYLYQELTIVQDKDSIKAELLSAIYLAKSQAGGYTNPDTLVFTKFSGMDSRKEVRLYPINIESTLIVGGKYVNKNFMDIFQVGPDGDYYLFLDKKGKDLQINDTVFERSN